MSSAPSPTVITTALEEPIRAELFSVERLEQHAESLAAAQAVIDGSPAQASRCFPACWKMAALLLEYYRAMARAMQQEQTITPAAEWLVDNFYIVEEQLREIRDDLPPVFTASCPNSPPAIWKAIRAYTALPGRLWRTPTAASIPTCCAVS